MSSIKHNVADVLWEGPGGEFEVVEFKIQETISCPFILSAQMKTDQPAIAFDSMLNAPAKIVLKVGEKLAEKRHFTGIITKFAQSRTGHGNLPKSTKKVFYYDVELRPSLWLLQKQIRSMVFQKKTAKDIVTEVLDEHSVKHSWKTTGSPRTRDYCLQYKESSFQFVCRLLEDEGIYFFFDHEKEEMVLGDDTSAHLDCKPESEALYSEEPTPKMMVADLEHVKSFTYSEEMGSGKFTVNDYNYETSALDIKKTETEGKSPAFPNLEQYTHGLNYKDSGQAATLAKIRKEAELAGLKTVQGYTSCRSFAAGHKFTLKEHFNGAFNRGWIIYSTDIHVIQGKYRNDFVAFPSDVVFHPAQLTPQPKVYGVQTAVVTGPAGEKVYLDSMGRCKIQFHWDREGKKDDKSSMWIRVSNGYAGKDYGIQWIPRIGHEVLVSFIDGDPDRPLVTGRVYNDANPAPLGPAQKWQNIIKTIKDNHILFDDKDGSERIDIRAHKDMSTLVENDKTLNVRRDFTETVHRHKTITVEEGDYKVTVDKGEYKRTVEKDNTLIVRSGDFKETVSKGSHEQKIFKDKKVEVSTGDYSVRVLTGSQNVEIKQNHMLKAQTGSIGLEAQQKFAVKSLSAGFDIGAGGFGVKTPGKAGIEGTAGLTMKSTAMASMEGTAGVTVKSTTSVTIQVGGSTISVSPAGITINGGAMVAIKGAVLQLN